MADIDLDSLSLDELKALQKDVNKAVEEYDERRKKEARAEVEAKARELGFTLAELVDGSGKAGKKGKAPQPAKYRHPENASLTWSGRGRQPGWIKDALANGTSLDELLIDQKS
ncbi:H-NS histone family protein [uncultured Jannaschia sp.]|uniref:H-NS histone family protein n=1 Tax=uncultured Jannaschia sp. TaxID=293347 RepID=UPI00260EC113|nr:H-NS histone family protein [uncultured Jannaschia sp.]